MRHAGGQLNPRTNRVWRALLAVVSLSLLLMFGFLYALTPPTVATAEQQATTDRQ
jgi:hypothetical protein